MSATPVPTAASPKPCHRPSPQPSESPRSPSHVTHCPCGKSTIAPSPSAERSQHTFTAHTFCSERIPNTVWSHPCQAKCHTRPRPPCTMETTRPCRCGGTTRSLPCRQVRNSSPSDHPAEESKILCDRSCTVLRACGRHHRRRVCCLLASLLLPQSRRERNALGHGREMEMGLGLGKSRG